MIQAKLTVNAPGDLYEQEADRVAETVLRMTTPEATGQDPDHGVGTPLVQRRASEGAGEQAEAPPVVDEVLRSAGRPLDSAARSFFEPRFGHDFSRVRVHTDAKAVESARAVNALAYTVGRDVVFDAGQFAPDSRDGRKLLAHELAHVVQQGGATAGGGFDAQTPPAAGAGQQTGSFLHPAPFMIGKTPPRLSRQPSGAKATLDYSKQTPVHSGCGDFEWSINWKLNNSDANTNGFIVQKVKVNWIVQDCSDKTSDYYTFWWEAWEVTGGQIQKAPGVPNPGDTFRVSNSNGFKGSTSMAGEAKFMENYTEPLKWTPGAVKEAGKMRATYTQPTGWSSTGTKYRFIGVHEFFCCEGKHNASKIVIEELDQ